MWTELDYGNHKEEVVQRILDGWTDGFEPRSVAGAPSWLRRLRGQESAGNVSRLAKRERTRKAFGYEFTPDVEIIAPPLHYVIELKRADKGEPLALAEVLHHAEWIRRYDRRQDHVIPVIVSQVNCWLRLAISSLSRGTVLYYELDILGGAGEQILWFDAPLAPWTPRERIPEWISQHSGSQSLVWHGIGETGNWMGLEKSHPERPAVDEEPCVMASRLADGRAIYWEGRPAPNGTSLRGLSERDEAGRDGKYFLWSPESDTSGGTASGPTWLGHY